MMEATATTKTAIIYCRVSSKEQVEGTSLEMQEKLCREYAEKTGLQVLGTYLDKGESAKTADRKQFAEAIDLCAQRKPRIDRFIVHKLDRFARNQADHVTIRTLLKRYGTELVSVTEPINESPIGKALEGMLSVFAEFDNNVRKERCTAGMLARLQQGIWVWGAPVGYYRTRKGANIAPNPDVAPFIRMAFEEFAKGTYTYESLADYLYARGFRTRRGKRPCKQLIEKIIKNSLYYGEIKVWDKTFKSAFEPIISEELFWRCQTTRRAKSHHHERRVVANPIFPLRRFVYCAFCRKPLTGSSCKGRSGQTYPYYHHQQQNCEHALFVPKTDLETKFEESLKAVTPKQHLLNLFLETQRGNWRERTRVMHEAGKQLQAEIVALQEERNAVFELHRAGKYSDEEFREQKLRLNERIQQKYLLVDRYAQVGEFELEDAIKAFDWCAGDLLGIWRDIAYPLKIRFQNLVFPEKVSFDGNRFGTTATGAIFQQIAALGEKKSNWVEPSGQRWNQIERELRAWLEFKRDFDRLSHAQYNMSPTGNKKPTSEDMGKEK